MPAFFHVFTGGRSTLPFSYSAIFCPAFSNFWLKRPSRPIARLTPSPPTEAIYWTSLWCHFFCRATSTRSKHPSSHSLSIMHQCGRAPLAQWFRLWPELKSQDRGDSPTLRIILNHNPHTSRPLINQSSYTGMTDEHLWRFKDRDSNSGSSDPGPNVLTNRPQISTFYGTDSWVLFPP
jgi:hypothetical protein